MEVLEALEKMRPDERRALIERINERWPDEEIELSESEWQLLTQRALQAQAQGFPGRDAEDALDEIERDLRRSGESV